MKEPPSLSRHRPSASCAPPHRSDSRSSSNSGASVSPSVRCGLRRGLTPGSAPAGRRGGGGGGSGGSGATCRASASSRNSAKRPGPSPSARSRAISRRTLSTCPARQAAVFPQARPARAPATRRPRNPRAPETQAGHNPRVCHPPRLAGGVGDEQRPSALPLAAGAAAAQSLPPARRARRHLLAPHAAVRLDRRGEGGAAGHQLALAVALALHEVAAHLWGRSRF